MKAFCHHINCYFTAEEEGWPPVGKNQGRCFQTNGGLEREPWASDHGYQDWQWNRKDPEVEVLRVPPFSAEKFLLTFWLAEVH